MKLDPFGPEHGAEIDALKAEIERLKSGTLTKEQVDELARHVVALSRTGMRVAIGDRTPKQYDRADQMAGYIDHAVRGALVRMGMYEEED